MPVFSLQYQSILNGAPRIKLFKSVSKIPVGIKHFDFYLTLEIREIIRFQFVFKTFIVVKSIVLIFSKTSIKMSHFNLQNSTGISYRQFNNSTALKKKEKHKKNRTFPARRHARYLVCGPFSFFAGCGPLYFFAMTFSFSFGNRYPIASLRTEIKLLEHSY